jgi:hypothetical protein
MSDKQDSAAPPPPPDSGPFALPPPPPQPSGFGGPSGYGAPRGYYPLDLDAILRGSASLFRFAWRTMLGAALIPYVIAYALMVPIAGAVSPVLNDWIARYQATLPNGTPPPFPNGLQPWLLLLGAAALVTLLAGVIASGAIIHVADSVFRGRPTSISSALGVALRRAPSLVGAQLLVVLAAYGALLLGTVFGAVIMAGGGIAVFLGLVVIVGAFAATMFLVVRWTLVAQAVIVEGLGPVDGLSRSWRLVAGSGWRALGYVLAVGLIGMLFGFALTAEPQSILGLTPTRSADVAIATVMDGFAALLFTPVTPLVMLLLYYDLRFRASEPAPQPGEARQAA